VEATGKAVIMRRHATAALTALATAGVGASLLVPVSAQAETAETATVARAQRACTLGVVGFDSRRQVRIYLVKDGRVVRDQLSTTALPFDVTAWGYYDNKGDKTRTLRLNTVTADGTPRLVSIKQSKAKVKLGKAPAYHQKRFRPALFADGGTFYAYTIDGGRMKRWGLYRLRDGGLRFEHPVRVGGHFKSWTSLQAGAYGSVHGVRSETLYGTTSQGELRQVVVPFKHPGHAKVRKLAASGYQGVTELSWGRCGPHYRLDVLVAIDPAANQATWTTITRPRAKARATLRGPVTGASDWDFSAAF
jgi:hypothetical protein